MRVMVIVPAFAEAQVGNPPQIARVVIGSEALGAPHVRPRIYKPSRMQEKHGAQENSPEHDRPAANGQQNYAQHCYRYPVILANPEVKLVLAQVGNVRQQFGVVVVEGLPHEDPTHVRPEAPVTRRVWIPRLVGELMMNAVGGHPEDWTAFQRKRCAYGEEVLQPLQTFIAAMGEQTV